MIFDRISHPRSRPSHLVKVSLFFPVVAGNRGPTGNPSEHRVQYRNRRHHRVHLLLEVDTGYPRIRALHPRSWSAADEDAGRLHERRKRSIGTRWQGMQYTSGSGMFRQSLNGNGSGTNVMPKYEHRYRYSSSCSVKTSIQCYGSQFYPGSIEVLCE